MLLHFVVVAAAVFVVHHHHHQQLPKYYQTTDQSMTLNLVYVYVALVMAVKRASIIFSTNNMNYCSLDSLRSLSSHPRMFCFVL